MNNTWVYDIETLASAFTYVAKNVESGEIVEFVIHKDRDDRQALLDHLLTCKGQVGFNNISFDYPIIHYFMTGGFYVYPTTEELINNIYIKAQEAISLQDNYDAFYSKVNIPSKKWIIPQLDLFKMWHYNNAARSTSLKALEISMNYPNVMESKIHHTKKDITLEELDEILKYNLNDVLATYEFYKLSKDKIDLRKSLGKQYKIPCINYSDSRIGEELILKLYSNKINQSPWDIKWQRTKRDSINLADCILDKIKFRSKEFNELLDYLKSLTITETKNAFKKSVIYKGFKYDYGTGGIHGCIKPGVYNSDSNYMILDADVSSLYPNIAITNNFYPEHLGKEFVEVYQSIIDKRIQAKKDGDTTLADGFKLSANSVYGKSNDENSFLYDPKFTMQVTLNGQLLLTLLAEMLVDTLGDNTQVLQINTDGITLRILKDNYFTYQEVCDKWQDLTNLTLEYANYDTMIIADVNNYLAQTTDGKIKYKGRFEIDKMVGNERAYHKDNSFKIIPIALRDYFIYGIPIEDTIMNHTNIYDFCGRQKFKGQDYGEVHYLIADEVGNSQHEIIKQQKNVRYYISTNGGTFIKQYAKGSQEFINKGYQVTIFNEFKESKNYNINYQFYIAECMKEINLIENKQLYLF